MGIVYSLYDALVSIKVPDEKAKAVIDALEREMMDKLATKADVLHAKEILSKDLQNLSNTMTIKLGSISVLSVGALYWLLKAS